MTFQQKKTEEIRRRIINILQDISLTKEEVERKFMFLNRECYVFSVDFNACLEFAKERILHIAEK